MTLHFPQTIERLKHAKEVVLDTVKQNQQVIAVALATTALTLAYLHQDDILEELEKLQTEATYLAYDYNLLERPPAPPPPPPIAALPPTPAPTIPLESLTYSEIAYNVVTGALGFLQEKVTEAAMAAIAQLEAVSVAIYENPQPVMHVAAVLLTYAWVAAQ